MDPLIWLARLAGLLAEIIARFDGKPPKLVEPDDPEAPKPAPTTDIDPDVRRDIEEGKL